MKLFKSLVTEKKKKGDTSPIKTRPILLVAENVTAAQQQLQTHWGANEYKWTRPDMIADFNPR